MAKLADQSIDALRSRGKPCIHKISALEISGNTATNEDFTSWQAVIHPIQHDAISCRPSQVTCDVCVDHCKEKTMPCLASINILSILNQLWIKVSPFDSLNFNLTPSHYPLNKICLTLTPYYFPLNASRFSQNATTSTRNASGLCD